MLWKKPKRNGMHNNMPELLETRIVREKIKLSTFRAVHLHLSGLQGFIKLPNAVQQG